MASNYDEVLSALRDYGLVLDHIETGKMRRCRVEGERERKGWYAIHELMLDDGDVVLVGSYGIWTGNDNGAQKISIKGRKLTDDQRAAMRAKHAEAQRNAAAEEARRHSAAAARAESAWRKLSEQGTSDYLARKGVGSHGVRFTTQGAIAIPMTDAAGRIHGLQFILSRASHAARIKRTGRDKEFWPTGHAKRGMFHLIGGTPADILLVAEGYATAASLHEATGLPVAIAFDAGNLQPVAQALRKRYPRTRILICSDDDRFGRCLAEPTKGQRCGQPIDLTQHPTDCPACGQPHKRINTGVVAAHNAALAVSGASVAPVFADDSARWERFRTQGHKITDFNDLHVAEGLHTVRIQIEAAIAAQGWSSSKAPPRVPATQGSGDPGKTAALKPIDTLDECLERFALIYGMGGAVFDRQEHCIVALSDMRDACISRELHRRWAEHPARDIVRQDEVGFDPAGEDPAITCNLWDSWPTQPQRGSCERLLELLLYMCAEEGGPAAQRLFDWVLRWLAYPIQHPGAKMKTTLVIHGPQGTGKNMFYECVMAIYGKYGRVIDQVAIEDKFNDWASRKLFLIADEVVARSDLYHVKNKLKAFITGDWIRINPKQVAAHDERNHVNVVFLSNERMPVVLEEDDRRHAVIWTPSKLSEAFYADVQAEINAGGIAALHDHLLSVDLAGFKPSTLPPMTNAKADLIELSLDSIPRFYHHWTRGEIPGIKLTPALTQDVYDLYRAWCGRQGIKIIAPQPKFVDGLKKKPGITATRERYTGPDGRDLGPHSILLPGAHFAAAEHYVRPPDGIPRKQWLANSIDAFRNAFSDYRGINAYAA